MSTDISSKFIKAFWCYLFLEKDNKIHIGVICVFRLFPACTVVNLLVDFAAIKQLIMRALPYDFAVVEHKYIIRRHNRRGAL